MKETFKFAIGEKFESITPEQGKEILNQECDIYRDLIDGKPYEVVFSLYRKPIEAILYRLLVDRLATLNVRLYKMKPFTGYEKAEHVFLRQWYYRLNPNIEKPQGYEDELSEAEFDELLSKYKREAAEKRYNEVELSGSSGSNVLSDRENEYAELKKYLNK